MTEIRQMMMKASNINGKNDWKSVEAYGNPKDGLKLIIKEKDKNTINKKIPFPELPEFINKLDNDNDSIFNRMDDLLHDTDFVLPKHDIVRIIKLPKRSDVLHKEKKRLAARSSKRKRRRKKTNKKLNAKSKQKTLKKRKKNQKKIKKRVFLKMYSKFLLIFDLL